MGSRPLRPYVTTYCCTETVCFPRELSDPAIFAMTEAPRAIDQLGIDAADAGIIAGRAVQGSRRALEKAATD